MSNLLSLFKNLLACTLLFSGMTSIAQEPELEEYIDDLKSLLTNVDANGRTYRQTVASPSPTSVVITVNEINQKGEEKETKYSLALSDINPRAVRSFPKGDIVLVEIMAKGNQKLIKKTWDGGGKIAYVPDFILYAGDSDNGSDLKQAFQESVPFALEVEQQAFSLNDYEDHLNWLTENVGPVKLADEKMEQQLSASPSNRDAVTLKQARDGRTATWEFNLSQLNPNSTEYHASGDELFIEIRTKGGRKGIKYSEDGSLRDYRDVVNFYASTPDALKKIQTVVKEIIPLVEKEANNAKPDFSSKSEIIDYINQDIKQVVTTDGMLKQNIKLEGDTVTISAEETSDRRHLENEYQFSLTDINPLGIKNESSKSRLFIELPVKNGEPFIRHIENGEPQNYRHYLRLYFGSRDAVLNGENALKTLIKDAQRQQEKAEETARFTLEKGWNNLESLVSNVENGGRGIEQRVQLVDNETSALTYTRTIADRKDTREFVYEFGAKEINPYTSEVQVSGPRVWVKLVTKGKQKVIKVNENGELRDYHYVVEIDAGSIANAKEILGTFKKLSEKYDERIGR